MGRGPSYPYVDLEQGIGLARKMYDYTKRAPAPLESVVGDAWKYSASSSSGQKVLAALKAYGLIEDAAGTNGKAIKLTQRSIRILLDDENSSERAEEIKKAAIAPKWYEFCWKTWGKEMPASMRSNLLIEHGFVDSTVEGFLKDYKKTIAFAGLLDEPVAGKKENGNTESNLDFTPGDYVQWESQGILRLPIAKRLTHFSPDGQYAFVEGEKTGIPSGELIPADAPADATPGTAFQAKADPPAIAHGGATMLQETFSLPDGTSVSIQWPAAFTPEAFEDFSDWLNIIKRKIGRTVKQAEAERNTGGKEGEGTANPPTPSFQTEVR